MPELLVISSFPNQEKARQIGTTLVEKQLAACVNLLPSVESIYRWEEKIECSNEVLAFIKTTRARYAELEAEIRKLHPYEVPEIIALEIDVGLPDYLEWLANETRSGSTG